MNVVPIMAFFSGVSVFLTTYQILEDGNHLAIAVSIGLAGFSVLLTFYAAIKER